MLVGLACDAEHEDSSACDSGSVEVAEPRIVFGQSVDGVRMLELPDAVEQKLGPQDFITIPDWCAVDTGYGYDRGLHAGLSVYFLFRMVDDNSAVGWLRVVEPYAGKTVNGIGVGSSRTDVECVYGPTQGQNNFHVDTDSVTHLITFEADSVSSIEFFSRFIPDCFQ